MLQFYIKYSKTPQRKGPLMYKTLELLCPTLFEDDFQASDKRIKHRINVRTLFANISQHCSIQYGFPIWHSMLDDDFMSSNI
jgi:hypothetical protein